MATLPVERRVGQAEFDVNGHRNGHEAIGSSIPLTVSLEDEIAKRVDIVGGKGASLAELRLIPGIKVPEGFVITTFLSDQILAQNPEIRARVESLDEVTSQWLKIKLTGNNEEAEVWEEQIAVTGKMLREMMEGARLPTQAEVQIGKEYDELCERVGEKNIAVAVRSSGKSEDGKDNSFAGQYDTYLHHQGKEEVLKSIKNCLASQHTGRAIVYRNEGRLRISQEALDHNPQDINAAIATSERLSHKESKLAVVVQRMVNAEAAGVGFSVDSKSGAPFTHIDISYGLGEAVVNGSVSPDSYDIDPQTGAIVDRNLGEKGIKTIYIPGGTKGIEVPEKDRKKFAITDEKAKELAGKIATIKEKYGREMDTEFAMDAKGEIYFLQARPETIASRKDPMVAEMKRKIIAEGVGEKADIIFKGGITGAPGVASGIAVLADTIEEARQAIDSPENKGKNIILVTKETKPDWVSVMEKVNGIITRVGGATCHAAIVSRELEVPCIVGAGATNKVFEKYAGKQITLDATERKIYEGELTLQEIGENIDVRELLKKPTKTKIGLIISNPDMARKMHALSELGPNFMISLLRIEFLLNDIGVHINSLVDFDKGELAPDLRKKVAEKITGYASGKEYFITKLSEGIASFAAVFPQSDITVRSTDFKTNEYENLIGGNAYETEEENPMMGWRGLVRSLAPENREAFKWELEAIKKAREMGYENIKLMFPVVRDPKELTGDPELDAIGFKGAYEIMDEVGLKRGEGGLKVGIMVEVPTNAIRIHDFIDTGIDFISFGTNDLTQFTLAVDRDNEKLQKLSWYGETNPAVVHLVKGAIRACKERGVETGICGQAPSNKPEFAKMLVEEGIGSIGVMPDRFLPTYRLVKEAEKNLNTTTSL